ncbi:MAG TPA: PAS domain-containing sensor histidine kinase [Armatimonadota bacterium]|jgi:two-component system phosphate regulon sensor histidine kinase PhoR
MTISRACKKELSLLHETDKVRSFLVAFAGLFLLASPEQPSGVLVAWLALALAASLSVASRWLINWERLEERGATGLGACCVLLGDLAWLMLLIAGTGGFTSPFTILMLIVILFAGVFFNSMPLALPFTTATVIAWFTACAAANGLNEKTGWILVGEVVSAVAVGWLGQALAGVLDRERQTNEQVVGQLTEGVLLLDAAGSVVLANERMGEILNLPSGELIGRLAQDTSDHPHLSKLLADVHTSLDSTGPLVRLVELDGEQPRDLRVSTVACPRGAQVPLGWVVVAEDITELRAASRMREEGLAVVSHELRSPLSTLRAVTQVLGTLGEDMNQDQRTQALDALNRETRRLSRLVSTLLDCSHLERGVYTLEFAYLDPEALVRRVAEVLQLRAEGRDLEINCMIMSDLPVVWGDPLRLEMVLCNLGENALKYTPDGGSVTLMAVGHADTVCLSVSDTGPGIPAEERQAVFDKFCRGARHHHGDGGPEGLGLGLFMARRLVELHGGEIRLTSEIGLGSIFEVILPAAATGFGEEPLDSDQRLVA